MSESRTALARIQGEPLLVFAAIGALLFVLDRVRPRGEDEAHRIVIDAPFIAGLVTDAARRTGHQPSESETESLVTAWVHEEVLYREARLRNLDVGDVIVRRRLVQKIELLMAAEAAPDEPTQADLARYLEAHADRYAAATRTSVSLCFYARELHADAASLAAADLSAGQTHCDPHLSGDVFRERTDPQLAALAGDDAVEALATAEIGRWQGVFETPRGFYLVRVDERRPGGPRALDEVRDDVEAALVEERRTAAVNAREAELIADYEVLRL